MSVMHVYRDIQILKAVFEEDGAFLSGILCDDNASYIKTVFTERIHQPENVGIVGNAQISANLIFLNVTVR